MTDEAKGEETVIVYSFRVYNVMTDQLVKARTKRTRDFVEDIARGEIIPGTAETVLRSKLDEEGRYVPGF